MSYHVGSTASTLASKNPFRYRGYYYDFDLGLYYLNSRYYDSNTGRFISPDDSSVIAATPTGLTDKNLFSYCDNNPVMRVDNGGDFWLTTLGIMAVGGLIGSAISAVGSIITQQAFNDEVNWKSVGVAAASGFVSGAVAASPLGLVGQVVAGGLIGGASYAADTYVNDGEFSWVDAGISIATGAFSGFIGGKGADNKLSLTNTLDDAKNALKREARRSNQKYAQKAVMRTITSRNNIIEQSVWSASFRFYIGNAVSNGINTWYANK